METERMMSLLFLDKKVDLNPTEKNIYYYIKSHLNKVVYMRIKELAEANHVSTSTILRFCRKFDCQGFSDFKLRLKYYLNDMKYHPSTIQNYDETIYLDFLIKSRNQEFKNKLETVAKMLSQAELLFFAGYGTSAIIAEYAATLFSRIHNFSFSIKDPTNYPIYTLPDYFNGKVCLVVFSVSGQNAEVLEIMERFRVHDIQIISITNTSLSKIAHLSDINIPYYINEEMYQDSNVTTHLPVISIIEILYKLVYNKKQMKAK